MKRLRDRLGERFLVVVGSAVIIAWALAILLFRRREGG